MFSRMHYFKVFILLLLCCSISLEAKGKKPFTFEDAMDFNTIRNTVISFDGQWIAYSLVPDRGDGKIIFQSTSSELKYNFPRGTAPKISNNSVWAAFQVAPKALEIENAKTPKDRPKSTFSMLNLYDGKTVERENVSKFEFSNDGLWLAYQDGSEQTDKDKKLKDKDIGSALYLRHLRSGTDIRIDNIGEFAFDSLSRMIFYVKTTKTGEQDGLYYRNLLESFAPEYPIKTLDKSHTCNLAFGESNGILAFAFAELDETGKSKDYSIYTWNSHIMQEPEMIIGDSNMPKGNFIPKVNSISWTKDGQRLYFGYKHNTEKYDVANEKNKYSDTTFFNVDSIADKADLYVWHWDDPLIMTNQRSRWSRDKDIFYNAVFHLASNNLQLLADSSLPQVMKSENANFTFAYSDVPYLKEKTWYGNSFDLYSVSLSTGERHLIESRVEESAFISPNGKYIIYYKDKVWYSFDNETKNRREMTKGLTTNFHDIDFDLPMSIPSYGFAGWVDSSDYFIVYDKFDIWMISPSNARAENITNNFGRKNDIILRIRNFDRDKQYFTQNELITLQGYNNRYKNQGIYTFSIESKNVATKLEEINKKYTLVRKAENADNYIFVRENYEEFPDLWVAADVNFAQTQKLSEANPQIAELEWGSTEIVRWVNSRGDSLDGYIIKPHNFDPNKKYPVYVYYYERFSQRTHTFSYPQINHRPMPQLYNSGGYLVFLPDIKYYIGDPGLDALDAIETGVKHIIDMGIADPERFCIQGHSWSGYQTAYIVTQTDFFKAACAGAPVSNMTSAYGQIRLESGLTRQFQYEAQQSRIGGNLWDSLDNYLRNSPLFHVNKTNTPLLMMFGDLDEAVPWQQGIELYMAYRRLSKNTILLQYENELHHPRKYHNKLDYARKMKEFFDHYVLGKEPKDWIIKGQQYRGK